MNMSMLRCGPVAICLLGSAWLTLLGCGSSDSALLPAVTPNNAGAAGSVDAAGSGNSAAGGGSAGQAVSGAGAAGAAQVVVKTDCSQLPKAGTWENISPPPFLNPSNMETLAVVVNPVDHTVFAAAGNATNGGSKGTGIYRSADCGANWVLVSTGTNSAQLQTGDPWAMRIDPVQPQTMYVNNGYGAPASLFKTTNGGVDWTEMLTDGDGGIGNAPFVQDIAIDPGNPQHVAVTFHQDCKAPFNKYCLSQTTDAGATWHEFNGPPQLPGWKEAASLTIVGKDSYLLTGDGAFFTSDGGKTWSIAIDKGILGSYGGGASTAPDGTMFLGVNNDKIHSSKADGATPAGLKWTPIEGSPNTNLTIDDGVNLYATNAWDSSGRPFYTAPLSDLSKWTNMESPVISRGSNMFAFDKKNKVLYAANWGAGLWRLVTP
jgi:hypothetical protein